MFPKKTPRKGVAKAATWTVEKWKTRTRADGWMTGVPVWLETHFYFVTHPCHTYLSEGKLECPHCKRGRAVEESAYFPWVDETGKPYASVVKGYAKPTLDALRPGDPVTVGKGKVKFDPVWVKPRANAPQWVPSEGSERTEEDFESWLLLLWKSPELRDHFGVKQLDTRPITDTPGAEMRRERALLQYQNWLSGKASKPDADQMSLVGDAYPRLRAIRETGQMPGGHDPEKNGKPK